MKQPRSPDASRMRRFFSLLLILGAKALFSFRSRYRAPFIRSYVKRLDERGKEYKSNPDLQIAIQCFNKDFLLAHTLKPFIRSNFKHLIVFADGCCDSTLPTAHHLLPGPQHLVIAANNRHEIANYRLALDLARHQGCRFLLLLQDDDLYPPDLDWLQYGLALFERHPRLLMLGFNVGLDFLTLEHADTTYLHTPLRSRPDIHPDAVGIDGAFLAIRHGKPPDNQGFHYRFCQAVYRAPVLIRVEPFARDVGIDSRFEPFQDDDTFSCLKAWSLGYQCALVQGVQIRRDIGIGGMRLMGHIGKTRAPHTLRNINLVHETFADFVNSGSLQAQVSTANRAAGIKS